MSPGTSASGGTRSGGDVGYQNVHQTGAVTQTPGRTTSTSTKGGDDIYQDPILGMVKPPQEIHDSILDKHAHRFKSLKDFIISMSCCSSSYVSFACTAMLYKTFC